MQRLNSTRPTLVFVYGTLRHGESNDITQHQPRPLFMGRASVPGRLYDLGECPGLILDPAARPVKGEVYAVAACLIPILDAIEDDLGIYFRVQVEVRMQDGARLNCVLYEAGVAQILARPLIACGDWVTHRCATVPA
jgi:gamma-glutamylcyclotransferase (GGCT)/AIG2-like uncharacterized protein YtfP